MSVPVSVKFVTKRHARRPYIRMYVTDSDGNAFDFSTASGATFLMYDEDGIEKVNSAGSIESPPTSGVLQYAWLAGDTDTAGDFKAEFDVNFAGEIMTLPINGVIQVTIYEDQNNA